MKSVQSVKSVNRLTWKIITDPAFPVRNGKIMYLSDEADFCDQHPNKLLIPQKKLPTSRKNTRDSNEVGERS